MEDKDTKHTKEFGYILGRAFGLCMVGCLMALSIATTVKLIMWIL